MTGMPEAYLTPEGLIAVRTGGQEWTVLHPDGQCSYLLELSATVPAPTYEEAREHFVDANERMGAALIEIGMALDLPRPTARYHWGQAEILAKIAELREAHPSDCITKAEAAGIPVIAHEGATR